MSFPPNNSSLPFSLPIGICAACLSIISIGFTVTNPPLIAVLETPVLIAGRITCGVINWAARAPACIPPTTYLIKT